MTRISTVDDKGLGSSGDGEDPKKNEERSYGRGQGFQWLKEIVQTVAIALVLTFLLRAYVVESFVVDGPSMEPTLRDGERLLISKLSYVFSEPKRGDVIIFRYPRDPHKDYVKRIVALPGDEIRMDMGRLYINGQPVKEPYALESPVGDFNTITVPEGCVFVLGDNRGNSEDSRMFGAVPIKLIKGRAFLVFWPLSQTHVLARGTGDRH